MNGKPKEKTPEGTGKDGEVQGSGITGPRDADLKVRDSSAEIFGRINAILDRMEAAEQRREPERDLGPRGLTSVKLPMRKIRLRAAGIDGFSDDDEYH